MGSSCRDGTGNNGQKWDVEDGKTKERSSEAAGVVKKGKETKEIRANGTDK